MNIDEIEVEFKTEIAKTDYFKTLCSISCMTFEEMLRQNTNGEFLNSSVRLAFDAWVIKQNDILKLTAKLKNMEEVMDQSLEYMLEGNHSEAMDLLR